MHQKKCLHVYRLVCLNRLFKIEQPTLIDFSSSVILALASIRALEDAKLTLSEDLFDSDKNNFKIQNKVQY